MENVEILPWALGHFGFSMIVGYSQITLKIRSVANSIPWIGPWIKDLLECPMCIGVWTGCGCVLLNLSLTGFWALDGVVTAGSNLLLASFVIPKMTDSEE